MPSTLPCRRALLPLVLGALALTGCGGPDEHDHPELTTGKQFYDRHCASCHKVTGEGAFLASVPAVTKTDLTAADLAARILGHGREGDEKMPSFASMPSAEAEAIATYVLGELAALRDR